MIQANIIIFAYICVMQKNVVYSLSVGRKVAAGKVGTLKDKADAGGESSIPRWYALRAFRRKVFSLKADFESKGWKTYMAMRSVDKPGGSQAFAEEQIIPNLIFVCCPVDELKAYKNKHQDEFMIYRESSGREPDPIDEKEMENFMRVVLISNGKDVMLVDMPMPKEGERVRVVDGIYKGAEGIVKRIKRDRKLLVAIEGVAVVAISNIPLSCLEKI